MILDTIDNLQNYTSLHPQFEDVVNFIKNNYLLNIENGKHLLNERGLFISVSEYNTKNEEDCFVECHRKYIDIQVVARGEELIGYTPASDCVKQPYDEEKDLQKITGDVSYIHINPNRFAIFFPHDGHMPNVKNKESVLVKKIVFKVPIQQPSGNF